MSQLIVKVARLWGKPEGSTEKFEIDEKISFPAEEHIDFASNFQAKVTLIRLKEEISALFNDAKVDINFICQRCLTPFVEAVEIPEAEREYFHEEPEFVEDPTEIFFMNKKPMYIDLNEMVRQEIILHFPLIPVCSKSCKGLCQTCYANLNKKSCKCTVEKSDTHKPFQNLKKLIK